MATLVDRGLGGAGRAPGTPLRESRHQSAVVVAEVLAQAATWQLVPRNAVARVELPRIPHRPVAVLNRWAIRRLLVIYESQPVYPLPALAVLGGLRCGELLRLYWADADFDHECVIARRNLTPVPGRGMVLGQTKIHQERRVDLGPIGFWRPYLAAAGASGGAAALR